MDSLIGRSLAHYRIKSLLGQGGMGAVYRAEDTQLGREVAVKVLPPEVAGDPQRLSRFQREARAVAALRHPAIVTIHAVEQAEGLHFLILELIEGHSLRERIPDQGMPLPAFFAVALPLAQALAAAHARGIVHRDVKPANVMVSEDGETKVLDFGLARIDPAVQDETAPTQTATQLGSVLGTPAYMSPEQARGLPVDARSDVFSTGIVLYEMLTGRQPFRRADGPSTIHAIVNDQPQPPAELRTDLPGELIQVLERCLAKNPGDRFASAAELEQALTACRDDVLAPPRESSRGRWVAPAAVALIGLLAAAGWWLLSQRRQGRLLSETIPRIEALLDEQRNAEAFNAAAEALERRPGDPLLQRLFERASFPMDLASRPPGARVAYRLYREPQSPWIPLGTTPVTGARVPNVYLAVRLDKDGYEPLTLATGFLALDAELVEASRVPEGMLWVPAGRVSLGAVEPRELPGFWIDRHEVTNREYQRFVDAGGYGDPAHWREPVARDGRTLTFPQVQARFVDGTGRPGPAGWELGRHPQGKEDHPVTGVSWYEAAAYARWARKSLPSVFHWRRTSGSEIFSDILVLSNFSGEGTAPVGQYQGLGPFGTYDMAGNVKEWCHNASGPRRFALGGGWNDPVYEFTDDDAQDPFERNPALGFRCVRYPQPPTPDLLEPLSETRFDFSQVKPVNDEVYAFFARLYDYEARPLEARPERSDDAPPHWRHEVVSLLPSYSGPRVRVHLFLPRNAEPPYQVMVNRPNSSINRLARIEDYAELPDFIPRSGRALVIPEYWCTLGRQCDGGDVRERVVRQVQDFRRTLDYLETRDDIDASRVAYGGMSAGGEYGPIYMAIEGRRLKAAVLVAAGFHDQHMLGEPPEVNPWNFAPRVTVPTLIINGETDFTLPYDTAQRPMLDLLGTDPAHKRLVTIAGGHVTTDRRTRIRETLDWLDRYLGPVTLKGP